MRNPLTKRLPRSLKTDIGKYAVIFIFITGMIAIVSGFLVASHSMSKAYDESFEKYNIEDGNLEFSALPDADTLSEIADGKLTFYENFYKDEATEEIDSTLRVFQKRDTVNLECLMDGSFPQTDDEIAIDRLYAENNKLKIGNTLTLNHKAYKITGLVALTDYSALFESPSDMMFDAMRFGVAVVTPDAFSQIRDTHLHYSYAWKYSSGRIEDDKAAKKAADDLLEHTANVLQTKAEADAAAAVAEAAANGTAPEEAAMPEFLTLKNFLPAYSNQAIVFTGNDITGDAMMFTVFLYILVAIIAFVSAITTSNTIVQEANVIGTLRASGYTRGELTRHYMIMPAIVTLAGAVIGNILGYSFLKKYMAAVYYNSYCLTTYKTLWNANAFLKTTVVPVLLMVLINFLVIRSKMRLSPLRFMRGDLRTSKRKKAFKLNTKIPILHRFRLRVLFQNIPNYIVLVFGIFLANIVLLFGLMFTPMLNHMKDNIVENMIAPYQYILKTPAETENTGAEKYCADSLRTPEGRLKSEDVMIYGFQKDSSYAPAVSDGQSVIISNCYAEKHRVEKGDTIKLESQYEDSKYSFKVQDVVYYPAGLAVFMTDDQFRTVFEKDADYYTGYFSREELTDLEENNIASLITAEDMTKVSEQLIRSMGGLAKIFAVFGIIMFLLLIYLLSKIIIERNSQAISMTKILGYSDGEINSLYIMATTVVTILAFAVTIPLVNWLMEIVIHVAMSAYPGWFEYTTIYPLLGVMFGCGILCYLIIAALLLRKIKRIPMSDALKHQE
ncbi:MAG: ABC transporter permease [Oscillospiraceae bacterium]|nr:ABC transporter permease [Oscillospiraceae bacterium]